MEKKSKEPVKVCFFCGKDCGLELHHIFPGWANRRLSDEDKLYVYLCHNHHNEPPNGVHFNKDMMLFLKQYGQRKYEETHTREEFMERYGKNYL